MQYLDKPTLLSVLPNVPRLQIDIYMPYLNESLDHGSINTPERLAMYLAQTGHESGSFKYMTELSPKGGPPAGTRYEMRMDLGNNEPGDGVKFLGRGVLQLTGKGNYRLFSQEMGVDFLEHPELVATPRYAFKTASFYWNRHELNIECDQQNLVGCTRKINGGLNGFDDRKAIYERACKVFGIKSKKY